MTANTDLLDIPIHRIIVEDFYDYDDLTICPACYSDDIEFDDEWCYCSSCGRRFYCPSLVYGMEDETSKINNLDRFDLLDIVDREKVGSELTKLPFYSLRDEK